MMDSHARFRVAARQYGLMYPSAKHAFTAIFGQQRRMDGCLLSCPAKQPAHKTDKMTV